MTRRTNVSFSMSRGGRVSCVMYDAAGNRVAVLAGGILPAGAHSIAWDAGSVQPGIYLCKLTAGAESRTLRLVKAQ